jgi:hypothetical protein
VEADLTFESIRPSTGTRLLQALLVGLPLLGALVAFFVVVAPTSGSYVLGPSELAIRTSLGGIPGGKDIPRAGLTARVDRIAAAHRLRGTARAGFCTGWFRVEGLGESWIATSCAHDPVVVVTGWTSPIVLTPADPTAFVAALTAGEEGRFAMAAGAEPGEDIVVVATIIVPMVLLSAFLVAPRRMTYALEGGDLVVGGLITGQRRIAIRGLQARVVTPRFGIRLWGVGSPGYMTGLYRLDGATTRVFATARGPGVLLTGSGRPIYLTPAEPHKLLAALSGHGVTVP